MTPPQLFLALLTLLSVSNTIAHRTPTERGPLSAEQLPSFQHPAGWHTAADIARVRSLIASKREPWKSAVE